MNLYDQQKANRKQTQLIMIVFIFFFVFLGIGFDYFFLSYSPGGAGRTITLDYVEWTRRHYSDPKSYDRAWLEINEREARSGHWKPIEFYLPSFPYATALALGLATLWTWWGAKHGGQAVLASTGARRVQYSSLNPQHAQLMNVVEEMSIAAGLPMPAVYVVPDQDPNAFATGYDPKEASVAVTAGLLDKLNREELQGVMAHEMSHIRNLDIRLMTTIAALIGGAGLLSDWARFTIQVGGATPTSSRERKPRGAILILFALWFLAIIIAPILTRLLALAVSRKREYLADASGAELTRNPAGLAAALKKIEVESAPPGPSGAAARTSVSPTHWG